MSSSRTALGVSTITMTLLVVAVLVIVNLVSTRFFGRADLTEDGIYSLSDASREIATTLEDPLIARAYVTSDLPPQLLTIRQYLLDLLSEYRAYGQGNFQFEVIDPESNDDETEAQAYGVQPFQANVYEADKVEMKRVYLGLVFIHGDRQEALAAITSTSGLEYQLTSAIRRVTRRSLGNVGVLAETGGPSLMQGLGRMQQAVSREYRIREVNLATSPMPADITVMIVAGATRNLPDTALYRLDQYVMRGGPVMFLLSGATVNMQGSPQQGGGIAFASSSNVDSLAGHYGAGPQPSLVIDARHNQIRAVQTLGFLQLPVLIDYPLYVVGSASDQDHVLNRHLDRLDLLFASPLTLQPQPEAPLTVVVQSSERSGVRSLPTMVQPPLEEAPNDYTSPHQPLVVSAEGILASFYADTSRGAEFLLGPVYDTAFIARSVPTRLLFVGDADLVSDQGLTSYNQVFLLNATDWLARNDLLVALRSRQVEDRPLDELDAGGRARIKWANLLGPALFVVIFGLARWRRRVSSKRS